MRFARTAPLNVKRYRLELSRTVAENIYMLLWPNADPANEFVQIFPRLCVVHQQLNFGLLLIL